MLKVEQSKMLPATISRVRGKQDIADTAEVADPQPNKNLKCVVQKENTTLKLDQPNVIAKDGAVMSKLRQPSRTENDGEYPAAVAGLQKFMEADEKNNLKKSIAHAVIDVSNIMTPSPVKPFNLRISSWNIGDLSSWIEKHGLDFVKLEQPDILCLQGINWNEQQLPNEVSTLGYHLYWLCMPGFASVATFSKGMPIRIEYSMGNEDFNDIGRVITAEYEKFYLVNVLMPNSGCELVYLSWRMHWEEQFQEYVKKLDAIKPVVICGDMNVALEEIDLTYPQTNTNNAGFTILERTNMSKLLALGFVDTFRHLYPKRTDAYTFWTYYMSHMRIPNEGWRLDYCIVSKRFVSHIVDNCIRDLVLSSDHFPITVFLNV